VHFSTGAVVLSLLLGAGGPEKRLLRFGRGRRRYRRVWIRFRLRFGSDDSNALGRDFVAFTEITQNTLL
jgi:hypothetical protein